MRQPRSRAEAALSPGTAAAGGLEPGATRGTAASKEADSRPLTTLRPASRKRHSPLRHRPTRPRHPARSRRRSRIDRPPRPTRADAPRRPTSPSRSPDSYRRARWSPICAIDQSVVTALVIEAMPLRHALPDDIHLHARRSNGATGAGRYGGIGTVSRSRPWLRILQSGDATCNGDTRQSARHS